jgi:hypothetical protein
MSESLITRIALMTLIVENEIEKEIREIFKSV